MAGALALCPALLPGGVACAVASGAASAAAGAGVGAVFSAAGAWVASGAVWLLGEVGHVLSATTTVDLSSGWFTSHESVMAALAAAVALPMACSAVIQAIYRQSASALTKTFLVHLPLSLVMTGVAVELVRVALSVTDMLSAQMMSSAGIDTTNLLAPLVTFFGAGSVDPSVPVFVVFVGGLLVAVASLVLWLELVVRAAAVSAAVLFLPLALAGLVWPTVSHWCRRLADTIAALVLSKLVIAAVLSLAAGALAGGFGASGPDSGGGFAAVVTGIALLVVATMSPFTLLKLVPAIEAGAVAHLESARHRMQSTAQMPVRARNYTLELARAGAGDGAGSIAAAGAGVPGVPGGAGAAGAAGGAGPAGAAVGAAGVEMAGVPPADSMVRGNDMRGAADGAPIRRAQPDATSEGAPSRPVTAPRATKVTFQALWCLGSRTHGAVAMSLDPDARPRYRFGPLERRGLVAGWRGGQIATVGGVLIVAVGVLRSWPSPAGAVVALVFLGVGVAAATWPVAGRTAEEWAPDALRHASSVADGRRRGRGDPFAGVRIIAVELDTPGVRSAAARTTSASSTAARGTVGLAAGLGRAGGGDRSRVGVVHDARLRTFGVVLEARAPGFVLLGEQDKAGRVAAWAGVLASLAREGSPVHRLQWVARVLPAGLDPARLEPGGVEVGDVASRRARSSYRALLDNEAPGTVRHEVLLALTVHGGRSARAARRAGGGEAGACTVLLREVAALRRRLADAAIEVGAVLDPDALSAVLRGAYVDPPPAPPVGAGAPVRRLWPWPTAMAAEWGRLRADGTWHVTYWVAEWPRTDVAPDFLGPLLLRSDVRRTVSLLMEPQAPQHAARRVEQARTADIADAELRRRAGFLATARRRREEEVLARREVELADGHGQYRFSGYVTVTAGDTEELDEACGRVEQAAAQAGLELRRCYGDQARAFACTWPLGRGLA